jgi:hypothetical protein
MNFYDNAATCLECYTGIDRDVDAFSKRHFGAPLCVGCQQRLKRNSSNSTINNALVSYFLLNKNILLPNLKNFIGTKQ